MDISGDVWQIVVHASFSEQQALYDKLASAAGNYLICQHDADEKVSRTHCHILFESPKRTRPTIQTWITEAGCGGRGNYAIITKKHTREKLAVYMIKGDMKHIMKSSFTEAQHLAWEKQWVTPQQLSPGEKLSKSVPAVKTQWEIMGEILAETRKAPGVWEKFSRITTGEDGIIPETQWVCHNRRYVFDAMIKHLAINKIRTSVHELERWYVTMMRDEASVTDSLYRKIVEKLS